MQCLSFKDVKFIVESLDYLWQKYNDRLAAIEENEDSADEASDLGNDCMFLESLRLELENRLSQGNLPQLPELSQLSSSEENRKFFEELVKAVIQLSLNDRLLLIETITESIREENRLMVS